jgi:hypothetical protein
MTISQVTWEAVAGGAGAIVFVACGWILSNMNARMNRHSESITRHEVSIGVIDQRLQAIDSKLDKLVNVMNDRH